MNEPYVSSSIKPARRRRTKAAMGAIREAIIDIVARGSGMTVRHLFYRLVSADVIEKTEKQYDVVVRLAKELRRSGDIPFGDIVDGSRLYTVPTCYDGIRAAITDTASYYRRSYWRSAPVDVEVWCEKDAIRALIEDTTWELAVPLMVTRGFASESVVQSLAMDTLRSGKPRIILSLNDYDPSGAIMMADIVKRAKYYAPAARFHSQQVALTRAQVTKYGLPTRPTKVKGNSHARKFSDTESVELDALDPDVLQELLKDAIEAYVDQDELAVMEEAEASERTTLVELAKGFTLPPELDYDPIND
jgi:hypothetical protein